MTEYNSKQFILEFFKNCKVQDQKGVITISEVPKEFEDFIGKKSPYKLVFDINTHTKIKDSELIMQGSYFLSAIRDYLGDKAQTSLLKINFKSQEELVKSSSLKNLKILDIKSRETGFIYEFYFLSTYQYLNEKKQSLSKIFVKDNEILHIDINKFKIQKGNKEEIPALDLTKPYQLAKKTLNQQVEKEIKPIKLHLREKIKKELLRIKDHYFKQIKEKDEELERCAEKIKLLQSKLKHTFYERDIRILQMQIRESKERLEYLKKKSYKERLRTEEIFHINDEVEKHILLIKNNLIHAAVIYYPIFSLQVYSKGKKSIIKYDPILDKILN